MFTHCRISDVEIALKEGYRSIEHVKRYTTLGMATDQGKTSNLNGLQLVSNIENKVVPNVGHTTFRPPYTPISIGAIVCTELPIAIFAFKSFSNIRSSKIFLDPNLILANSAMSKHKG